MCGGRFEISVIVPVYKSESYLQRCLDSLLAQNFKDFEILLVDDGSPDRSGDICDEYAQKDSRVRVFHKQNGGVSSARNIGIDNAKGKWVTFIDSDDYVEQSYLDDFGLAKCDADIYMQGYKVVRNKEIIRKHYFSVDTAQILSFDKCFVQGERNNILNSPVCKLFKYDILKKHSIRFDPSISYGEDHLFVLSYLQYAEVTFISPCMSYNYVQNGTESLTHRVIPYKEMVYYMYKANQIQIDIAHKTDEMNSNVFAVINWRTYVNLMLAIRNLFKLSCLRMKAFQEVKSFYKSMSYGYHGLRFRQRCVQFLYIHLPASLSFGLIYVLIKLSDNLLASN